MLRHTYGPCRRFEDRNLISHFLMATHPGHQSEYIAILILASGAAMREAQEKISAACSGCWADVQDLAGRDPPRASPQSLQEGQNGRLARAKALGGRT